MALDRVKPISAPTAHSAVKGLENWIPKEQRKEEPTGTMGQMIHGTAMGMINANLSAFQFTPALMDGAEKYYACM